MGCVQCLCHLPEWEHFFIYCPLLTHFPGQLLCWMTLKSFCWFSRQSFSLSSVKVRRCSRIETVCRKRTTVSVPCNLVITVVMSASSEETLFWNLDINHLPPNWLKKKKWAPNLVCCWAHLQSKALSTIEEIKRKKPNPTQIKQLMLMKRKGCKTRPLENVLVYDLPEDSRSGMRLSTVF